MTNSIAQPVYQQAFSLLQIRFQRPWFDSKIACPCLSIENRGYWVQDFSLILDSSVGLLAGIHSAGDLVTETVVRILHKAEDVNVFPFELKIACLCQRIEINNKQWNFVSKRCISGFPTLYCDNIKCLAFFCVVHDVAQLLDVFYYILM